MLEKGKKVGEYILLEKLGTGGFGDVWKAEKRTALDVNYFALKFFRPKQNGLDFDKIRKEIGVWKQLKGLPHIISVIELDRVEDYVYVVSDFADSGSLEKYLQTNGNRAKTEAEAVKITLEILTGLENLHGKGFVHRDLKPDNILIMNGRFCLADFGISREIKTHSKATGTAGTMEYMPPEAFEKTPSVTPQTDIWAVGVILQRLLTGALPYPQDEQPSLIAAILMSEPEEMPASVSPELRATVKKALQKNRENRFQTANEMHEVLRDFLKDSQKIVLSQDTPQVGTLVFEDSDNTAKLKIEPTQDWQDIEAEKEQQRKFEEAQKLKEAEELKRLQEIEIQRQKDEALRLERERQKEQDERKIKKAKLSKTATALIVGITLGFPILLFLLIMFAGTVLNSLFKTDSNTSSVSISNSNQSNSIINAPATNKTTKVANTIPTIANVGTNTNSLLSNEEAAKNFAKDWFKKKFSPAENNRQCGAQNYPKEQGGELNCVLLLEDVAEPTVTGSQASLATERNSGITWSGNVTFNAKLSKLFAEVPFSTKTGIDFAWQESEWKNNTSFGVAVFKKNGEWQIDASRAYISNSDYSNYFQDFNNIQIVKFYPYNCRMTDSLIKPK